MQEKSNKENEYGQTALDNVINRIWRNDDIIVTVGICLAVMALFQLVCVISMSQ
jgi:uncharacterized protein YaiI (UPF0178 family)